MLAALMLDNVGHMGTPGDVFKKLGSLPEQHRREHRNPETLNACFSDREPRQIAKIAANGLSGRRAIQNLRSGFTGASTLLRWIQQLLG
jgi:hypothetical protein